MTTLTRDLLTDDMLARFDERAPVYDRENRFFDEDWQELKESGYLLATVPTEFGGGGLNSPITWPCNAGWPMWLRRPRSP